ncbi:MAG: potassium channel family protein [Kineosporiaceae bacterium]
MSSVPTRSDPAGGPRPRHPDRYELLFALLLLTFVLGAFVSEGWARVPSLLLYVAVLLIALRSGGLSGTIARTVRAVLAVGTIVAVIAVVAAPGTVSQGVQACWLAVVVLTTIVVIVRRVLHHRTVTMQTIFGALSAYLLIGFFFTSVYTALARLDPVPFFAGGQQATSPTLQYFSFVTLTTTGYGDYTAAGEAGRSLAVLEALVGQIFLVTLVARLVAMFGRVRPEAGQRRDSPPPDEASDGTGGRVWDRPPSRKGLS